MTLDEALEYRKMDRSRLAAACGLNSVSVGIVANGSIRMNGMKPGILKSMVEMSRVLKCGFLITEDGIEVELYEE